MKAFFLRNNVAVIYCNFLFWLPGAWEYIEKTRDMVHDLEKRVQAAKNNVESMSQLMTKWCEAPLYERKEGKKEGLLNLEVNKHQNLVYNGWKIVWICFECNKLKFLVNRTVKQTLTSATLWFSKQERKSMSLCRYFNLKSWSLLSSYNINIV